MQTLIKVAQVTSERFGKYRTQLNHCDCPDYQRGGSYSSPDHRDCKHTLKLQSETSHFRTRQLKPGVWICNCIEWDESGEGNQGTCVHTKALQGWKQARLLAAR